jgi:hypothetical protein
VSDSNALRPADVEVFARLGIPPELLDAARVRRLTHEEARSVAGIHYRSDTLEGIHFPNVDPERDKVRGGRVRRDHPELGTDGKPIAKYVGPPDRHHLYFAPGVGTLLADSFVSVVFVEAEKSVLALTAAAARANRRLLVVGTGGCWGWRGIIGKTTDAGGARVAVKGALPDFDRTTWPDRDVVILFDTNAATNGKVQAARRALAKDLTGRGATVRIAELPSEDGVNGPDDYIGKYGDAALFAILDAAKPAGTKTTKKDTPAKAKQGRGVQLEDPDPWPEPVNGAALLDAIAATFTRYLALPTHGHTLLALWVLHTYTFAAWFTSPFLAITTPAKRCGKTLLLIVLGALVPRRLFASNVTPAVLFRTIDKYNPTLLIDEADTFIRENDELRGVLNSGHTKTTAVAIRAVGKDFDPRAFSTWCPKAICLIGRLPDTLGDRAIEIAMRRRTAIERIERLRQDRIEGECSDIRRQAARWADDHLVGLQDADPAVPPTLHDRAADCWRPLLSLADRVGADWPTRAREAAKAISGAIEDETDQLVAVLALADVRTIFGLKQQLSSADIVQALQALESRPWATWGKDHRGLTTHALGRLLKDFKIHPIKIRFGSETANGYTRRMFEDAWTRYIPVQPEHQNNFNNDGPETSISQLEHPERRSGCEIEVSANNGGLCSNVPVQTPEGQAAGEDAAAHHPDLISQDPEEREDQWVLL